MDGSGPGANASPSDGQLSELVREYERERLRWGLSIDAAGIGTFDWELRSDRLVWDERLLEIFGYDSGGFSGSIEAFYARLHPDDLLRVTEALQHAIDTCDEYDRQSG